MADTRKEVLTAQMDSIAPDKVPVKAVDPKTGETIRQPWEQKYYDRGYLNPNWGTDEQKIGNFKADPTLTSSAYKAEAARRARQ